MSQSTIRKKFITSKNTEETFSKLQTVLTSIGLKNLKNKKSVDSSYLLVEYKEGFMQKGEIEFYFVALQSKTEFSIEWKYPSNDEEQNSNEESDFGEGAEIVMSILSNVISKRKSSLNHDQLIEEIKQKMDAHEIFSYQRNHDEQLKKEVIVKIRCRACREVFDEALIKCPKCGMAG
jgi:cephalosporin-C deacetylase-like acetyl esterase